MASELITNTVVTVVGAMATALGGVAAAYLKKKLGVVEAQKITEVAKAAQQELTTKKGVIGEIVKATQEQFGDKPGADRFNWALGRATTEFQKLGWDVNQDELRTLIDAACNEFKLAFGDKWNAAATNENKPAEPAAK